VSELKPYHNGMQPTEQQSIITFISLDRNWSTVNNCKSSLIGGGGADNQTQQLLTNVDSVIKNLSIEDHYRPALDLSPTANLDGSYPALNEGNMEPGKGLYNHSVDCRVH